MELPVGRGRVLLGTQAFDDPSLVGNFYPDGTSRKAFLESYARRLTFLEVNATFHQVPAARTVAGWARRTPDHFVFAFKVPRVITHGDAGSRPARAPLEGAEEQMDAFLSLLHPLRARLGAVVFQFPPSFRGTDRNVRRLLEMLGSLPRPARYAVELRDGSWLKGPILDAIAEQGAALVLNDIEPQRTRERFGWPEPCDVNRFVTAPFSYLRLVGTHSDPRLPRGDFSTPRIERGAEIRWWAQVAQALADRVETVFVSINRHYTGHAPTSLRLFGEALGHPELLPPPTGSQLKLPI